MCLTHYILLLLKMGGVCGCLTHYLWLLLQIGSVCGCLTHYLLLLFQMGSVCGCLTHYLSLLLQRGNAWEFLMHYPLLLLQMRSVCGCHMQCSLSPNLFTWFLWPLFSTTWPGRVARDGEPLRTKRSLIAGNPIPFTNLFHSSRV